MSKLSDYLRASIQELDEKERLFTEAFERLQTFKDTHDRLEFGSDVRDEWKLLAFQELVRDAWPFMEGMRSRTRGAMKDVCEEWLSVRARLLRTGPPE